jgi:hypothetical protein
LPYDESGYPPVGYERLWATPLSNGNFRIENIPFYVMGISSGDEVSSIEVNGEFIFSNLVKKSGNSTFRLFLNNAETCESVREILRQKGCTSEFNQHVGVVAVEVPESVEIYPFLEYIVDAQNSDELDIEEGALRHDISEQ